MDLELSQEQRLLRDSAQRFAGGRYDATQRRKSGAEDGRWSREIWREMAELGWFAIMAPEADGGLGGGPIEVGIVAEALGRALALEPFLDVTLATQLVAALGDAGQRERLLPGLMDGSRRPAIAHAEGAGFSVEAIGAEAEKHGRGYRLSGRKDFVSAPASADALYVSARAGDGEYGAFVVMPEDATIQSFETVDGREAARVTFDGAKAERLGTGDAKTALGEALDLAAAVLASEAVGCMDALLEKTVAYTKTREQFGRPLAANQVLRHRMADMAVRCEEARGVALRALIATSEDARARSRAASAAKFKTGRAGRYVAESAIQLHGAMGVTEELDVGLFAKRLLAIDAAYGGPDQHLRRHAALRASASTKG